MTYLTKTLPGPTFYFVKGPTYIERISGEEK
jgi:hypothetical protein